jgi:hypothetical protein
MARTILGAEKFHFILLDGTFSPVPGLWNYQNKRTRKNRNAHHYKTTPKNKVLPLF